MKTVQEMVDKSLFYIFGHTNFKTLGSGRTDALVSANSFACQLFSWEKLDPEKLCCDLNSKFPPDIEALSVEEVGSDFEIISGSKLKTYRYFFSFGEKNHPFCAPIMAHRTEKLDIELMKQGAKLFEGTHNFYSYCHRPNPNKNFKREISKSEVLVNDIYSANFFPEMSYYFEVCGSGFMRHQVRLMMGTLFNVGLGLISLSELKASLEDGKAEPIGFIAPSSGLMLADIQF
ncbi:MAG: hypothetical protein KAG61_05385 [Bacteriovoracaceae bacterium]|nr:hypothetical protein [Bacteriovoracaceae bacterium]